MPKLSFDHLYPIPWTIHRSRRRVWRRHMREVVFETALTLLKEVGPRKFTVVEVARRANVARTSIYKHIGMKAELLAACRDYVATRVGSSIHTSPRAVEARVQCRRRYGTTVFHSKMERVRQACLSVADKLGGTTDLLLLSACEGFRAHRLPRCASDPLPQDLWRTLNRALEKAASSGDLRPDVGADGARQLLLSAWWMDLTTDRRKNQSLERILRLLAAPGKIRREQAELPAL